MRNGRFEMLVPDELMARVDEWRGRQTVPPTRAAALRYLVSRGLGDSDAEYACSEAVQVVGALADYAGAFEHPDVARALDNLHAASEGKALPHCDLLPWPKKPLGKIHANSR